MKPHLSCSFTSNPSSHSIVHVDSHVLLQHFKNIWTCGFIPSHYFGHVRLNPHHHLAFYPLCNVDIKGRYLDSIMQLLKHSHMLLFTESLFDLMFKKASRKCWSSLWLSPIWQQLYVLPRFVLNSSNWLVETLECICMCGIRHLVKHKFFVP